MIIVTAYIHKISKNGKIYKNYFSSDRVEKNSVDAWVKLITRDKRSFPYGYVVKISPYEEIELTDEKYNCINAMYFIGEYYEPIRYKIIKDLRI